MQAWAPCIAFSFEIAKQPERGPLGRLDCEEASPKPCKDANDDQRQYDVCDAAATAKPKPPEKAPYPFDDLFEIYFLVVLTVHASMNEFVFQSMSIIPQLESKSIPNFRIFGNRSVDRMNFVVSEFG